MHVTFNASERSTLGVEIEIGIVDIATRELACVASPILTTVGAPFPEGEHPRAKHELYESTIEVITGICDTVDDARRDLTATLAELDAVMAPQGFAFEGAGLHPTARWFDLQMTQGERYQRLVDRIQWPARRLMTHGVHFHVGVRSAEKVVAITDALSAYLPHFVALSASSPFWHGHDSGLASVRTKIFEAMPTAGLPPKLEAWSDFEAFMDTLLRAGSISSVREVWWDIRPHPDFGTVELRMCDGIPTMSEVCAMAALAQSLVEHLDTMIDEGRELPSRRDWVRRENKWRAARDGVQAELVIDDAGNVRPIVDDITDMVNSLRPTARTLKCEDELMSVLDIARNGPSYMRQRNVIKEGGSLLDVVDLLVAEFAHDRPGG
jgi:glutamate---cysteine ligase / carboxylate-amine ligase